MTLDLEVNEVEVKGLTSLASVTEITVLDFNRVRYPNHQLPPWALSSKEIPTPALPPNTTPSTM
jgi:hypothetical protein